MRVSDGRYSRDLKLLGLAWRMVLLGARTPTVADWTHFSVFRIRRLRRTYASEALQTTPLKGVTPTQARFFSESTTRRCETAILAGLFRFCDVLPKPGTSISLPELRTLSRGEHLCTAYETFRRCCPDSRISFEHAVLLLDELVRAVEIRIDRCHKCFGYVVHDCLSPREPTCGQCSYGTRHARAYFLESGEGASSEDQTSAMVDTHDDRQGRLF